LRYEFINTHCKDYKVNRLCAALSVSSSGYYDWRDRPISNRDQDNQRLVCQIKQFHQASRAIYGSPRITKDLQEAGERCSENRVAKLMKAAQIQSKMAKKFVITTDSKHTMAPAPNLLRRQFKVDGVNRSWVTDTTFIGTRQGWMYLAVVLELYSRQVIGWSMGNRNTAELVSDALMMALWRRGKVKGVIVHSDRGSTYASKDYQQRLAVNGLHCSMSRKGDCLDNAVAESFFGTIKTELADHEDYLTRDQARQSIFEYIEVFYNRQRRHSFLDYMTPVEFERKYVS
jgi:putative transposase